MFFLASHMSIKECWLGACSLQTFCESSGLYVEHVVCMLGCWYKTRGVHLKSIRIVQVPCAIN